MNKKHYLEKDYDKLIHYAKSMGLKVLFKPPPHRRERALHVVDGDDAWIEIYNAEKYSRTLVILALIHELAHHRGHVNRNRVISDLEQEAFEAFGKDVKASTHVKKSLRKVVYQIEKADSIFQVMIWNELELRIPLYKVMAELEVSNWMYRQYYLTGKDPTQKQRQIKKKQLTKLYRKKLC